MAFGWLLAFGWPLVGLWLAFGWPLVGLWLASVNHHINSSQTNVKDPDPIKNNAYPKLFLRYPQLSFSA